MFFGEPNSSWRLSTQHDILLVSSMIVHQSKGVASTFTGMYLSQLYKLYFLCRAGFLTSSCNCH